MQIQDLIVLDPKTLSSLLPKTYVFWERILGHAPSDDISGIRGTRYEKLAESTYGGMTPLHVAAKYNNLEGAKMLIEAGAKIMPKDDTGKTPLDYAESTEMIKLLKSYGAKEK